MEAPFVLEPCDSGRSYGSRLNFPVRYRAAPGQKPIFSGGRVIKGWRKGFGPVWTVDIPAVKAGEWTFNQLFVNDRRAVRARSPNQGYFRTAGQLPGFEDPHQHKGNPAACMGFKYAPGDLSIREDLEEVNIFLYHAWTSSLHWIKEIDERKRLVHFANRCGWPVGWWERDNQRYHIENYRRALDQPGEWYLDRAEGRLHYWPLEGENMATAEVVAPVLRELVRFEGQEMDGKDQEGRVTLIELDGLSFRHTDWHIPDRGMADGQAATFLTGAIHARRTSRCTIKNCEIAHVGSYGAWFDLGCQGNVLSGCEIHDLAGGGVRIGSGTPPGGKDEDRCTGNRIDNCFIHDGGCVFPAGCGVLIQHADHSWVTHNEICDFFYTGISIGWSWGYMESAAHHNVAEYNHVHHLGWGVLSDLGGVYTLGVSPGTVVNQNIFHDIQSYSYGGWGLYTDEGSTGIEMTNNIVYNTKTGGFHQHYGKDNRIINNILAFSATHQLQRTREEGHNSFFFERNIVYFDSGILFGGNWRNDHFIMDHNLYWDTSGKTLDWNGGTFEAWQALGHDRNSFVADPLFEDAKNHDFRLKKRSPAHAINFKPIDTTWVGLYFDKQAGVDPAWVDKPKTVNRPEMIIK
jgi:hypothetical protein